MGVFVIRWVSEMVPISIWCNTREAPDGYCLAKIKKNKFVGLYYILYYLSLSTNP
jgi:hypothetical protein